MSKKVTVFEVMELLPLVANAVQQIGVEVTSAKRPRSEAGRQISAEEAMQIEAKAYEALRPLAVAIVRLATS